MHLIVCKVFTVQEKWVISNRLDALNDSMRKLVAAFVIGLSQGLVVSIPAAIRYDGDGVLSSRLELERWYINRARFNPEAEADRLGIVKPAPGGHPDYDCCADNNAPNDFGSSVNEWTVWKKSKPPLAPNALLSMSSYFHSLDLAETGAFSHRSPSSNYYPQGSWPWDRTRIETYTNSISGNCENIGFGGLASLYNYPPAGTDPVSLHSNLYCDVTELTVGHRKAILNATAREIGLGNAQSKIHEAPWYWTLEYDTQDFGCRSNRHFFTETIFYDANANDLYDPGEGVGGVQVRLWDGTNQAAWYDESQASGSFAVPLDDLVRGHVIAVELFNPSAFPKKISIPRDYSTLREVEIAGYGVYPVGSFVQPDGQTNVGFRDLRPVSGATNPD